MSLDGAEERESMHTEYLDLNNAAAVTGIPCTTWEGATAAGILDILADQAPTLSREEAQTIGLAGLLHHIQRPPLSPEARRLLQEVSPDFLRIAEADELRYRQKEPRHRQITQAIS